MRHALLFAVLVVALPEIARAQIPSDRFISLEVGNHWRYRVDKLEDRDYTQPVRSRPPSFRVQEVIGEVEHEGVTYAVLGLWEVAPEGERIGDIEHCLYTVSEGPLYVPWEGLDLPNYGCRNTFAPPPPPIPTPSLVLTDITVRTNEPVEIGEQLVVVDSTLTVSFYRAFGSGGTFSRSTLVHALGIGLTTNHFVVRAGSGGGFLHTVSVLRYARIGSESYGVASEPSPLPTEASEASSFHVLVWPNPSRGRLRLRFPGAIATVTVTAYDMLGREIWTAQGDDARTSPILPAGSYTVRATDSIGRGGTARATIL